MVFSMSKTYFFEIPDDFENNGSGIEKKTSGLGRISGTRLALPVWWMSGVLDVPFHMRCGECLVWWMLYNQKRQNIHFVGLVGSRIL